MRGWVFSFVVAKRQGVRLPILRVVVVVLGVLRVVKPLRDESGNTSGAVASFGGIAVGAITRAFLSVVRMCASLRISSAVFQAPHDLGLKLREFRQQPRLPVRHVRALALRLHPSSFLARHELGFVSTDHDLAYTQLFELLGFLCVFFGRFFQCLFSLGVFPQPLRLILRFNRRQLGGGFGALVVHVGSHFGIKAANRVVVHRANSTRLRRIFR
mmetsp:Transcript_9431/g.35131  ORF Transcript_9431/g.35131 Transcript_9431/m.35131 type:complete len:214 (+) Transcript_9431:189-830(+)